MACETEVRQTPNCQPLVDIRRYFSIHV
jgi:hypothetical protein